MMYYVMLCPAVDDQRLSDDYDDWALVRIIIHPLCLTKRISDGDEKELTPAGCHDDKNGVVE